MKMGTDRVKKNIRTGVRALEEQSSGMDQTSRSVLLFSVVPLGALLLSVILSSAKPMPTTNQNINMTGEFSKAKASSDTQKKSGKKSFRKKIQANENFDWTSGPRSSFEMDEEWLMWTGADSEGASSLQNLRIDRPYRLSMVLSDVNDLANSPLRVMQIYTIGADLNQADSVTYFNRQVDGLEEKNFKLDLSVPHRLEKFGKRKDASPQLLDKSRYVVKLRESTFKRPFDLRDPVAISELSIPNNFDFDVLQLFASGGSLSVKNGLEQEVDWNGQTYSVQVEARQTELDTLVIELQYRAVDSLQTYRVALIYE